MNYPPKPLPQHGKETTQLVRVPASYPLTLRTVRKNNGETITTKYAKPLPFLNELHYLPPTASFPGGKAYQNTKAQFENRIKLQRKTRKHRRRRRQTRRH